MKTADIYHILNGDALRERFPSEIGGQIIVARECLVDGPVAGINLRDIYENRAKYISQNYGGTSQDYFKTVVTEFEKIESISGDDEIVLWFEADLFCQVNLWFSCYVINQSTSCRNISLVQETGTLNKGFGSLSAEELVLSYATRIAIDLNQFNLICSLWNCYRERDLVSLEKLSKELQSILPHIGDAVRAHIDRIKYLGTWNRPEQTLLQIMTDLKTDSFSDIFQEFSSREAIYGFGDLQVKKILRDIEAKQVGPP